MAKKEARVIVRTTEPAAAAPEQTAASEQTAGEVATSSVSFVIEKVPAAVSLRILSGGIFYSDGRSMKKLVKLAGKPVTVTINQ